MDRIGYLHDWNLMQCSHSASLCCIHANTLTPFKAATMLPKSFTGATKPIYKGIILASISKHRITLCPVLSATIYPHQKTSICVLVMARAFTLLLTCFIDGLQGKVTVSGLVAGDFLAEPHHLRTMFKYNF